MAEDEDDDPSDAISLIEARLEHLVEVAERCRKIIVASKAAIAAGCGLLLAMLLGLLLPNQIVAIGSMAAALIGIVSLGSNISTLQQTTAAIGASELQRSELIGSIDLKVVGDSARLGRY
jgi:hypothetical protein